MMTTGWHIRIALVALTALLATVMASSVAPDNAAAQSGSCPNRDVWVISNHLELDEAISCYNQRVSDPNSTVTFELIDSFTYPTGTSAPRILARAGNPRLEFTSRGAVFDQLANFRITGGGPGTAATITIAGGNSLVVLSDVTIDGGGGERAVWVQNGTDLLVRGSRLQGAGVGLDVVSSYASISGSNHRRRCEHESRSGPVLTGIRIQHHRHGRRSNCRRHRRTHFHDLCRRLFWLFTDGITQPRYRLP